MLRNQLSVIALQMAECRDVVDINLKCGLLHFTNTLKVFGTDGICWRLNSNSWIWSFSMGGKEPRTAKMLCGIGRTLSLNPELLGGSEVKFLVLLQRSVLINTYRFSFEREYGWVKYC